MAPVNETDTVLLPEGLNTLKRVARLLHLNLDGGFDSRHNRKAILNAGLIRSAGGSVCSMPPSIRYRSAWSGPLPGRKIQTASVAL
jgi:hypothetical protein